MKREKFPDGQRRCCVCKTIKALEEFIKTPNKPHGRGYRCKPCARVIRASMPLKPETKRRRKLTHVRAVKRYAERNPTKRAAHLAVRAARQRGEIVSRPCEVCTSTQVQAHHDDYLKPLEVRWLCRVHHRAWHLENGPGANAGQSAQKGGE